MNVIKELEGIQRRKDMNILSILNKDGENVIVYYNFLYILYAAKSIASIFHSFFLSLCIISERCSLDNMYASTDITVNLPF